MRLLRIASACLVLTLLGLLVWKLAHPSHGPRLVADVRKGEAPAAPPFRLRVIWPHTATWPDGLARTLGTTLALRQLRGHPAVLNFWASWCVPCAREAPRFVAAAQAHAGRAVFLGVDVQDFTSDARGFLRRHGIDYVVVRDGGMSTSTAYGLIGLPETYYLDPRGRIVRHDVGEVSSAELDAGLAAIEQPAAAALPPARRGGRPDPKQFLAWNASSRTVDLTLLAGLGDANGGFNFGGYGRGELLATVPRGWRVTADCENRGFLHHSCAVVSGALATVPAFPGASTPDPVAGLRPGAKATFSFVPTRTGTYRIACLVPGHEQARMFAVLVVAPGGRPSITARPGP